MVGGRESSYLGEISGSVPQFVSSTRLHSTIHRTHDAQQHDPAFTYHPLGHRSIALEHRTRWIPRFGDALKSQRIAGPRNDRRNRWVGTGFRVQHVATVPDEQLRHQLPGWLG